MCEVDGCDSKVIAKGLCSKHYQRMKRTGDTSDPAAFKSEKISFLEGLPRDKDECIIWPFSPASSGRYGALLIGKVQSTAHRMSLRIHKGEPPTDKHVAAHDPVRCTSSLCVNPNHLRWATSSENSNDQKIAGTIARGVKVSSTNMSEGDVIDVYKSSLGRKTLADMYGVSTSTIDRIKNGKCWSWLTNHNQHLGF